MKAIAGKKWGGDRKTLKNYTVQSAGQKWTTDANYTIQHPQEE